MESSSEIPKPADDNNAFVAEQFGFVRQLFDAVT